MTVAGESEIERKGSQVALVRQAGQGGTKAKSIDVAMQRQPGVPSKKPGEVKWRTMDGSRDADERQSIRESSRRLDASGVNPVAMGDLRFRPGGLWTNRTRLICIAKDSFEHIDRDFIGRERVHRSAYQAATQPLREEKSVGTGRAD